MGMSLGGRQKAEINVTPMIDVLLVLIIIFMLITPTRSRGLTALVPQPPSGEHPPATEDIVITVLRDGNVRLNNESLDLPALQARLTRLFQYGASQVVFLRADKDLEFGAIAGVIDLARGSGVDKIALMTN